MANHPILNAHELDLMSRYLDRDAALALHERSGMTLADCVQIIDLWRMGELPSALNPMNQLKRITKIEEQIRELIYR